MKALILKLVFIIVLGMANTLQSCNGLKDKEEAPGIVLYKTNGEYFDLVTIGMKDGYIIRTPSYINDKYKFTITSQDTIFRYRARLVNGYILSNESSAASDVFLNLTFKQYMILEGKYGASLPHDTLLKHIIDSNPYTVFYSDNSEPRKFNSLIEKIDTTEINLIIKENKIDQYFERIK